MVFKKSTILTLVSFFVFSFQLMGHTNDSWLPPVDTFQLEVNLPCGEDSLVICANMNGLNGAFNSAYACTTPMNGGLTIANDTCFIYHPLAGFEGIDSTCIIVCDSDNLCDTFYFTIHVEACNSGPCADIPYDLVTAITQNCNDELKICNPFPLGEALLYDYTINGAPYNGNIGVCSFDTAYTYSLSSIPDGGMSGPYEVVNWEVDGNSYTGTFNTIQELSDLMNQFDPLGFWELDAVTSNVTSFNSTAVYGQMTILQVASNDMTILSLNSLTAPVGSSIFLANGINEVILTHQNNASCIDTFKAVVHCDQSRVLTDTIVIGELNSICADPAYVPGTLEDVGVKCINCQSIEVVQNGFCAEYLGLAAGTDTILVTGCDEFGLCDSIRQVVTVRDPSILPVAFSDLDTTEIDTPIALDLLANDAINGTLKNIFILDLPRHGILTISTQFEILYEPGAGYCGPDKITYQICNENGCDTALAQINVRCNKPLVYNGFSPNGDGRNDLFRIFNIDEYPENHLRIYNRWGNLVYEAQNYANTWDGHTFDNRMLSDGTYFYSFESSNYETVSGYIQIQR